MTYQDYLNLRLRADNDHEKWLRRADCEPHSEATREAYRAYKDSAARAARAWAALPESEL